MTVLPSDRPSAPQAYQCKIIQLTPQDTWHHRQREVFLAGNRRATRICREKKQQQSQVFFDLFLLSTLMWITEKELELVIKNKGDKFCLKKNMKIS